MTLAPILYNGGQILLFLFCVLFFIPVVLFLAYGPARVWMTMMHAAAAIWIHIFGGDD